ncbi:MAG: hypothetical protein ACJ8F7_20780 [Gemmataceae bacterium]
MLFDLNRVRQNAAKATTEDLLDRLTVYRAGMEPAAIEVIEAELDKRGIGEEEIQAHATTLRDRVVMQGAVARKCSLCHRPAVKRGWGWYRLFWKFVPLIPGRFWYCEEHAPRHVR